MIKRMVGFLITLLLIGAATDASAQQRQITGVVSSAETNMPLSAAIVRLVGTDVRAITTENGNFTLRAPAGPAHLRVSLVGYRTQEITVPANQNQLNVRLLQDVLHLEGLVVTGQATTVARRNLANAVAVVTAEELERGAPAQTVEKALQGRIAGATITTNSGAPGGGVQFDLRGVSTINGSTQPLFVIDGVIVSDVAIPSGANSVTQAGGGIANDQDAPVNRIADINPHDIETIEILKGASAAAIYGSRASNGVIIITTKSGHLGAPRIRVSQKFGVHRQSNTLGSRAFETFDEAASVFGADAVAPYFNSDGTPKQIFDHEEELAGRSDLSSETSFSINGGSETTKYFVSGLVANDAGIIAGTGFDKQSVRLNLDQKLGSRVKLGVNTNVIHSLAKRGLSNNDNAGVSYYVVLAGTPSFANLQPDANGVFPENPFERSNPLQTVALMKNDEDVWRVIASANAGIDLVQSDVQTLRLLSTAGLDYFDQENSLFFPPELEFEPQDGLPGTSLLSNSNNLNLNGNINLVHTFAPASGAFSATTSTGLQYTDRDLEISRILGQNLIAGQRNVDAATVKDITQDRTRVQGLGVYLQEELLTFDDRLLLTGSVRADRSSANGDPDEYFYYPKAAASYRLPGIGTQLDEVKLRVAYGQTGNQPLFGQKFTSLSATNNIGGLPGILVRGVAGDPNIRPETQTELEGGVDATLFNGNATLSLTAYKRWITDLLLERQLAPSSGFNTQFFNGGEMQTHGFEAALAATPIRSRDFSWFTRTTFFTNGSEITDLPVPAYEFGGFASFLGTYKIEEGKSATQIVGLDVVDGESVVRQLGDATPDFQMGFSNDFSFRRFSLSTLWDWRHGGDIINLTRFLYDAVGNSPDFQLPAGVDNPRPISECEPNCSGLERLTAIGSTARALVEDGSFLKLRNVELTYEVPTGLFSHIGDGIESVQLTLSGRNLITITDYTGLDPEVSNFGNQPIARSIDVAPFPPNRSFWLGVNVIF